MRMPHRPTGCPDLHLGGNIRGVCVRGTHGGRWKCGWCRWSCHQVTRYSRLDKYRHRKSDEHGEPELYDWSHGDDDEHGEPELYDWNHGDDDEHGEQVSDDDKHGDDDGE